MLRVIEGFDFMPSGLSASARRTLWSAKRYYISNSTFPVIPDVRTGRFSFGKALSYSTFITNTNSAEYTVIPIPGSTLTSCTYGIAFCYGSTNDPVVLPYISLYSMVNSAPQLTIVFKNFGVFEVRRGDYNGTLIETSQAALFQDDRWFYFEVQATINDTTGSIEARINTVPIIQMINQDTQALTTPDFDSIVLGWVRSVNISNYQLDFAFDDLYLLDGTGTINNTFLGNARVVTQFAYGAGAQTDFSIGGSSPAATNWQSVLNQNVDDTEYVYSPNVGDYDLYQVQPILNTPLVFGLQVAGAYRQDDATQRVAHNVIKAGATIDEGADWYTNQSYTFYQDIWELNPDTGLQFTGAEVNAVQIGPKVAA